MSTGLAPLLLALSISAAPDDLKAFQGTWKVVAIFEHGEALSEEKIATSFVADGKITVDGPVISLLPPGQFEPKQIAFTIDPTTDPKGIDLVGTSKVGSKGIYMLSGDSLMICLPGPDQADRPTDFNVSKASKRALLILKREAPASAAPPPAVTTTTAAKPAPPPPAPPAAEDMRKLLIGTWGSQDDDAVYYTTLNPDGTFSSSTTWKSGFKKAFHSDVRSSGTWSLEKGMIVSTVTVSTDRRLVGQIYSVRVTHLNDTSLLGVDDKGRTFSQWRVR